MSIAPQRTAINIRSLLVVSTGLSAVALAGCWLAHIQRRRRRSEEHTEKSSQQSQSSDAAVCELNELQPPAAELGRADSPDTRSGPESDASPSAESAVRRDGKSAEAAAAAAAADAAIEAATAGWELCEEPASSTNKGEEVKETTTASSARSGDLASQISMKNPEGLADLLIDCLVHIGDEAPGTPDALNYDMGGLLSSKLQEFQGKLTLKKIQKLFSADTIQLRSASLDAFDALVLARVLRTHNKKVECLDLSSNRKVGAAGVAHLVEHVMRRDYPLMSLTLSGCGLMNSGVIALAESLPCCSTLEILELCHNGISDGCVPFMCKALEANSSLQSLFLNNDQWCPPERQNRITDEGAAQLARVLAAGRDVKISLQRNAISDERQGELRRLAGSNLLRF